MTAHAAHPASAHLKPADPLEWALAAVLWPLALAVPVALVVWLWPVIVAGGAFGVAVFFVVLAAGLFISGIILWLFAPLIFVTAALLGGVFSALRGVYRMCTR